MVVYSKNAIRDVEMTDSPMATPGAGARGGPPAEGVAGGGADAGGRDRSRGCGTVASFENTCRC